MSCLQEDEEDVEVDEEVAECAQGIVQAAQEIDSHFNLDLGEAAKHLKGDTQFAYRSLLREGGGVIATERCLDDIRNAKDRMLREGGPEFVNPLTYGVNPLFDRMDFEDEAAGDEGGEGRGFVRYVGDCVYRGSVAMHPY
mmetsp:Transcript_9996/g.24641  ORF Transcript_9996/g.24641 Transcript_9996/m.24641 type:complete len:140 (-) Transcript_9996:55-474(-)